MHAFVQVNALLVEFQNNWAVFEQFHAVANLKQIKVTIHTVYSSNDSDFNLILAT